MNDTESRNVESYRLAAKVTEDLYFAQLRHAYDLGVVARETGIGNPFASLMLRREWDSGNRI